MNIITLAGDIISNLDKYLGIIFQTGIVLAPFLPGDSLLFASGALVAFGSMNVHLLFGLVSTGVVLTDTIFFWTGRYLGPKVFSGSFRWLKQEHLNRTQAFYQKHGGKTIFLARFIPIIRTFVPFLAGVGRISYSYFISYNLIAGIVWTSSLIYAGYFFGSIPFVKDNFPLIITLIILISLLPPVIEYLRKQNSSSAVTKT